MRNAKELAKLLVSERFRGYSLDHRNIFINAAKSLLQAHALECAINETFNDETIYQLLTITSDKYQELSSEIFGTPLSKIEESPSD